METITNQVSFSDVLRSKGYSDVTIYQYNTYRKIFERKYTEISEPSINSFVIKHNNSVARAFLRAYLEYKGIDLKVPTFKGRAKKRILRVVSYGDYIRLRNGIQDRYMNVAIRILFEGGLRISELVNIRKCDFDYDKRTIKIIGKGNKQRIINITKDTAELLFRHLLLTQKDGFMFKGKSIGRHISVEGMRVRIYRLSTEILGARINPHAFRHGCATFLYINNMNLINLQDYLGHSELSTVQKYAHVDKTKRNAEWSKIMESV